MKEYDLFTTPHCPSGSPVSLWARVRRGLLFTIGCGCLILGAVLMFTLIRPEILSSLNTAQLSIIVGLIAMPALTMVCIRFDRVVVKSVTSSSYQRTNPSARIAHGAHDRGSRVVHHARLSEAVEPSAISEDTKKSHDTVHTV